MATRSPPRAGTGYIGLESWLANNGQQAAGIANNLASNINAQGQQASGQLDDINERFINGVDGQNYAFDDSGLRDAAGNYLPGSVPRAQQNAAAAEAYAAKGWTGPTTLEEMKGYDTARAGAAEAQRNANLATDQYGREALLQNQYGKGGGYSPGSRRLDSALVGAAGGDTLNKAKSQWGGLLGKFDTASANAKSRVAQVQKGNAEALQQYKDTATKAASEAAAAQQGAMADAEKARLPADEFDRKQARVNNGGRPLGKKTGGNVDGWGNLWAP